MGWIDETAHEHEGWVGNVLADGRVAGSQTSRGVIVHQPTAADLAAGYETHTYPTGHVDVVIPWEQITTWRVLCECGWTGGELPARVDERGYAGCPEEVEEAVFWPQWREHMAPHVALAEVDDLADQHRALTDRLAEKVGQARAAGASWEQIARATGMTAAAAAHRYAD